MQSLSIFVCNNGYGHIQRVRALLDHILESSDIEVNLYADPRQVERVFGPARNQQIIFVDFYYPRRNFLEQTRLVDLDWDNLSISDNRFMESSLVVSDGVIDILALRPDTVILANFFWHEVLEAYVGKKPKLTKMIERHKDLIHSSNAPIFCSRLFATPTVRASNVQFTYGVMNYFGKSARNGNNARENLLFSCGLGGESSYSYAQVLKKSAPLLKNVRGKIFVERNIVPADVMVGMPVQPADFSYEMYTSCRLAVIRPGFGTLNCCLSCGVVPLVYKEARSFEMTHNVGVIKSNNLGFVEDTPGEAFARGLELMRNGFNDSNFQESMSQHGDTGIEDCSRQLLSYLNR